MAVVAEFISVLRKIRDVIYPEINELYDNSLELKKLIDVGKVELDENLGQFNIDYQDFNVKKDEVDAQVLNATNSATSAGSSATTATNKSNEIKAITAQSVTGAPGTNASASYNPTDGKFTFIIPQGSKGDKGESFTVNSSGITESRAIYNSQIAGWSFLDVTTSLLYFKISNTSGDWSAGVPFGKGDRGETGDTGVGIVSFTFVETTDLSGLPAKSGATDTYRVTLTNDSTFDYQAYNGMDYSQELLDSKMNKDINSLTNKTTPINADEMIISDSASSFSLKKLSFSNLKDWLKSLFIQKDYVIITGSATFSPTNNTIVMTEIGSLGLKIGDVIKITGSVSNNKTFNVENIYEDGTGRVTDLNTIIVNYEHRGTSTPVPSKRLIAETSTISITLITNPKEFEGLGWCTSISKSQNITYTNSTGRTIKVAVSGNKIGTASAYSYLQLSTDDIIIAYSATSPIISSQDAAAFVASDIIDSSTYVVSGVTGIVRIWAELR